MSTLRNAVAAVTAATVVLAGCSADSSQLPPLGASELTELYDEELAALGLVLTDRGGLVDAGTYAPNPAGTHLSLYVAPASDRADEAYVDGLVEVTAVFADDVFARWPGLASFDVCQEAVPVAGSDSAPARTQITLTRAAAASVEWSTATLEDVDVATQQDPDSSLFLLDDDLRSTARRMTDG